MLFFALITATALLSFASCGNSGGNDSVSPERKAKEYFEKMLNAKTEEEAMFISIEFEKWYNSVSYNYDDKKAVDTVLEFYMPKLEAKKFDK